MLLQSGTLAYTNRHNQRVDTVHGGALMHEKEIGNLNEKVSRSVRVDMSQKCDDTKKLKTCRHLNQDFAD